MLKKSTLLFIGTFFLLFIGLSDYGYGCHRDNDHDGTRDPHGQDPDICPEPDPPAGGPGNSPGKDVGEYDVMISNGVGGTGGVTSTSSPTNSLWLGRQKEKLISINHGTVPQWTNFSFFADPTFFNTFGDECFGGLTPTFKQGSLSEGRGGTAEGHVWFTAKMQDGTDVDYELQLFGVFAAGSPRPPIDDGDMFHMEMLDWIMTPQGGNNIQMMSCLGESVRGLSDFDPLVLIDVVRIN